jgi:dihydroorotase
MIRAAKQAGVPVTCDVAVHHLHLCDVDIGWFDSNARLVPPLRTTRDRDALRAGLADRTIDVVCSDHAPVDDDGKQLPFGEAEPGATGLELLLPLTLKWAEEEGVPLPDALAKVTSAPARLIAGLTGDLAIGSDADICIFDPAAWWKVDRAALRSTGKNTPFLGLEVPGRVRCSLVGGQVVHET